MSIHISCVDQSCIMLDHEMHQYRIPFTTSLAIAGTHIRHRILIILPRRNLIRLFASNQQSAPVERCCQARDDSVRLGVRACGERTRRAAEDVAGGRFLESDAVVGVGEGVVLYLAGDVAEGGLRVDCEGLGGVAGPD